MSSDKVDDERERAIEARESALKAKESELTSRELSLSSHEKVNEEKARTQDALQEHIVKLQEVNKRLVIASITSQSLADQLQAAKLQMAHLAHHDFLTDLPNRLQLSERLVQAIALATRHRMKLALLFLDLDRFKVVNDSLGHNIGDQLLKEVAQRLVTSIRSSDTVCRQGGDEFIILLSEVDRLEDLIPRVEKIHGIITQPYLIDEHILHIGASVGISIYPDDAADSDTLIRHADAAMYSVKDNGRNRYAFFEREMNDRAVARHGMEVDLREAVAKGEFILHYQAQVDIETENITGAEALIRWQHPKNGLLLPIEFVAFAEECGAILSIGRWALREACRQAQNWRHAGLEIDSIAVNISASEFESRDFMDHVLHVLDHTGLPPQHLELELTESVMMRNSEATISKLSALRALGIRIAVDDFGTGYSSLSYLKRFPIDTLKIDQSFVSDIHANTKDDILVDAVIAIGKSLNYQVIAEGIESREQFEFLRARECTGGQGFHISMPMTAENFTHILRHGLLAGSGAIVH